ncbi:DUF2452 domain-containing protein [Parasegetibacter sp. NRK P23]|uniref:DUF2452 domain-containing protein n=1 Tax=Parasegetibacter sp. NRK P23 TaxID=2942999 RepID=UPI0020439970|nr:DUF2452 domain-containing protein [Parasegetibacter sp. NRK P23]MCM5526878.1 DUF2452 domain-containing protein [Parasegetibacter sp. NRK P23]
MIQAYNFLASWQLFPEKGVYEKGERPKSGTYRISNGQETDTPSIVVNMSWVTLENQSFASTYTVPADGTRYPTADNAMADEISARFPDGITFETIFYKNENPVVEIRHEIMPNGYLRVTRKHLGVEVFTNVEYYHKQMNVLPYSASVSGAVIRPTEEGMIRHKALTAMEEQTNMQLEQIRKQIELLALQAQEIQKRKELSMMIYGAKLSFQPVIGQVYYLYEKKDGSYTISMISPKEWGGGAGPFLRPIAPVKLLADHTWMEVS